MNVLTALVSIFGSGFVGSALMLIFKRFITKREEAEKAREAARAEAEKQKCIAAEKAAQEQTLFRDAILALLHDRIFEIYEYAATSGYASVETLRNVDYLYQPYHALGGNGTGTELYERLKSMPPVPPAEKE